MADKRISQKKLRKIVRAFGGWSDSSRPKGSHRIFKMEIGGSVYTYPIPDQKEIPKWYIKALRKKFNLMPENGVSDEQFYDVG